jgi:hypothetical protein
MVNVTVVFTNGDIASFAAEEFEVDLDSTPGRTNKYPYKDARGNDSAIYLRPNMVAGVFVTQPPPDETGAISTQVPGFPST